MSCATVYKILPNGDVEHFEDVHNGSAGAPVIWHYLCEKIGLRRYGDEGKLWPHFGKGKFPRDEDIALGFTFDGAYVRREHIPELVRALRSIWEKVNVPDAEGYRIVGTIPGMADALEKLYALPEAEVRGACFRMTSVCENAWRLCERDEEGERIEDSYRSFNFDRDKVNAYKADVVEIIDAIDAPPAEERAT